MRSNAGPDTGSVTARVVADDAGGGRGSGSAPFRLGVSKTEAAAALGVSVDFLEQHVMDELRVVRRGRRRLIPVTELERWLAENAAMVLAA